jgi:hypothetical protein
MDLQLVTFHEEVSGSLSQSLANVIEAGLDEMIPVHTPAYQPGHFQKILITHKQILFFYFCILSPRHSFSLSFSGKDLISPFAF